MRGVVMTVMCAGLLCAAGCGGGGSATGGATSTPAPSTSSAIPPQVGSGAYAASALTSADLPAGFVPKQLTAQQDFDGLTRALGQQTVTPSPACETLGPLTADTAKTGLLTTFVNSTTQEVIAEFVAPAGSPTLDAISSQAAGCARYAVSDPDKGIQLSGAITVVPTPEVTADATLGLSTTVVTTTAGGPPVTTVQTDYLAETRGTLVTINTKGGPSGAPIDAAVVARAFTTAVANVDATH